MCRKFTEEKYLKIAKQWAFLNLLLHIVKTPVENFPKRNFFVSHCSARDWDRIRIT